MWVRSARASPWQPSCAGGRGSQLGSAGPGTLAYVNVTAVDLITRPGVGCVRGPFRVSERRVLRRTRSRTSMQVRRPKASGHVPGGSGFLQTDPQPGGSANDYDYANQDPINQFDLDGNMAVGDTGAAGVPPRQSSNYAGWINGLRSGRRGSSGLGVVASCDARSVRPAPSPRSSSSAWLQPG